MLAHFVTMQMQLILHTLIVEELSYFWRWGRRNEAKDRMHGWHDYRELFFEQAQYSALSDIKTETSNLKFEVWLF